LLLHSLLFYVGFRMTPVTIPVTSERAVYRVLVGRGLAGRPADWLSDAAGVRVVVSCRPVWRALGRTAKRLAPDARPVLIPDGERAKTLRTAAGLYDAFLQRRLDRTGAVLAVGGGVVGDVAGFAAATYLRGVPLIQVPTTLLAQVDSSIGGKVGVNLPAGKNLVGAFHAPSLVVCDPDVLATLPRREFRSGLYEVIKYGVIASLALFERVAGGLEGLLAQHPSDLPEVIAECCRIKAAVVSQDERESGPRRVLNFGHTVGHALEGLTRYRRFRHGEAVAYGMLAAARISAGRGLLTRDEEARLQDVIRRLGRLPPVSDLRASRALDYIRRDKKVAGGRLHFVLARGLGATEIVADVTPAELTAAMRAIGLS
jgi:3-dehydroquinate synthase